jgi:hypothetical protein
VAASTVRWIFPHVAASAVRWIFPVVIAVVVVAVLIGLVRRDSRRRSRARHQGPRAERSSRSRRLRDADDLGEGLSPYELNRPSSPRDTHKDDNGGAFGSGGPSG